MHGGGIIKCLDKQLLFHLYHRSRMLGNKRLAIKYHYPLLTFQNHFTNLLNSILEKQILWGDNSDIRQYLKDNECGTNVMLSTFMEIFHMKRCVARDLLSKNPIFTELPRKQIMQNYQILKNANFITSLIQDNVLLLTQDTEFLRKKIDTVQRFTNDINDGIFLLYHSATNLRNLANFIQSQPECFETKFQVKPRDLYTILSKYLYIIMQEPESTIRKLKLLLDYGVSVDNLLNYEWPMYCSYEKMQIRLEIFSQSGLLPPPRPWVLTCNDLFFNSKVKEKVIDTDEKSRIVNFLSKKSGYSEMLIRYKISAAQSLKLDNLTQVKELVDIITEEGYTYDDIIWSIKVLDLRNDFIKKRFFMLQKKNHKAPFLNVLLLSNEAFVNYMKNLSIKE
ncbi:uncharacterized protein LOC100678047 [Nasonia vitripennis]|uniref:Uncharacterized protein n=1 Tax=Nasonia vitripennis TaxID=7425 RepID=A0A7M7GGU3_NASVI|nr:uncharacterized protein LOC100678047 [Nasonia vitripennis]